ncbi:hypothetical protein KDY119_01381 [Luteimicrobium xylanilyticum]|uniref:Uncharacterized protein n=1 Tax=Luteimicrobium xylanilyticum TaxID=1133546 RepID=A0A5P9QBP8_9MICO|nr:hypothetical protein KDY119_01381 [Luteimicrobium xylanilyticum]
MRRQEQDCRALAKRLGLKVGEVFTENDVSASTRSRKTRPLFDDMVQRARVGEFGAILAYSNSRLTRRPREFEDLLELAEAHGVRIATVASGEADLSTADGRAIARTLAAWDAAEAERTSERVRRAKLQRAQDGGYRGGPRPFGYESDGVTVMPTEATALLEAARGILAGRSLEGLTRDLAAQGITTTQNRPIDGTALRRILQRPRNAGLIEAHGEIVGPASWPAIIPEDVWRGVLAVLSDPSRRTTPGPERKWLGSGLYLCGVCDSTLVAHSASRQRQSYRCRDHHVHRTAADVDDLVLGIVAGVLRRSDLHKMLAPSDGGRTESLRTRSEALRARLTAFEADYAAGHVTGRQLASATARVQAELDDVAAEIASTMRRTALGDLADAADPGAAFLGASLDRQRAIVDALAVVKVYPGRKGRPSGWKPGMAYTDLDSVKVEPRGEHG